MHRTCHTLKISLVFDMTDGVVLMYYCQSVYESAIIVIIITRPSMALSDGTEMTPSPSFRIWQMY